MKIAVVYNRESQNVINLFGVPNREKYGKAAIKRIVEALKAGGHQVATFEGDKQLIANLEKFMPRVVKGELPGLVFNISYGIQGQARYTHVPSILEMVGVPYVGSGPLAHSLALDKVVAKMIFRQKGLPTPDFAVLETPDFEMPPLAFPMIVKPKNEAVSFGLKIVNDEAELREAAGVIFDRFKQPVLAEQYIDGREINVGLLGNNPPETLPPVELIFGEGGPPVYTYEDKVHKSGREVIPKCPADLTPKQEATARELAVRAFAALGCCDCSRVDMRLDADGNFYILEINSLASLGVGGSYVAAAKQINLDYTQLINRLVEVASARYFGTPTPPNIEEPQTAAGPKQQAFGFLTERRDRIERRLESWCAISSRTGDPLGIRMAAAEFGKCMTDIRMRPLDALTDERFVWTWATRKGLEDGTLLILHVDTPMSPERSQPIFRRDPEYLSGEGIGASRAPLTMTEFALRALRAQRALHVRPLGVLCYADEGEDARYSNRIIREAVRHAARVIVLRPGSPDDHAIVQRRGLIQYRLTVEGKSLRLGQPGKTPQPLLWLSDKVKRLAETLTDRSRRMAVSATDLRTDAFPMRMPHRASARLVISYYEADILKDSLDSMNGILSEDSAGLKWMVEEISNRPPMKERKKNKSLAVAMAGVAEEWGIPFQTTSSLWPSVAGLVPNVIPVICGMGPVAENLYTPQECVRRISLIQRTLLLTQFLLSRE